MHLHKLWYNFWSRELLTVLNLGELYELFYERKRTEDL